MPVTVGPRWLQPVTVEFGPKLGGFAMGELGFTLRSVEFGCRMNGDCNASLRVAFLASGDLLFWVGLSLFQGGFLANSHPNFSKCPAENLVMAWLNFFF
jgi:hypothetical protein